jgi:signal peptidase I
MDKRVVPNTIILEEAGQLLNEGRTVRFTPLGNSMLPFIRGGRDSVVLQKKDSVEVGDIVLIRLPGRYVLHRVIALDGDKVTLMGDGNSVGTEECTRADIMGTAIEIGRGNRTVKPGKGRIWRALKPFRRYILAIYRRIA